MENEPDGEWPVAYHGTTELNAPDTLEDGFQLEKGRRFAFGKGIYCSPNVETALYYAQNYDFQVCVYFFLNIAIWRD